MASKSFDWKSLQKYASPKAAEDFNAFLEKLPHSAGHAALIAAGIAWAIGAGLVLYTMVQVQSLTEWRIALQEAEALQPPVPRILDAPVGASEVESFVKTAQDIYRGLEIKSSGSSVVITSRNTSSFAEFREAIGHVQSGGQGWRVSIERLCVGRECQGVALGATLRINKVSVTDPTG